MREEPRSEVALDGIGQSAGGPSRSPLGPVDWCGQAVALVRASGPGDALRGMLAGVPLAWVVLWAYALERQEGVHTARPWLAFLLALAWVARGMHLSALGGRLVARLRPELTAGRPQSQWLARFTTAAAAAIGAWGWCCLILFTIRVSPFGVIGLIPVLAIRGGIAPSWSARAACEPERGVRAVLCALDDARGMRADLVAVEFLILLGMLGLFINLYALATGLLMMAHALFGLEVALLTTFTSLDNPLPVLVLSLVTLLAFEPLRAAMAALVYTEARTRRDGADLSFAVERAIALARRSRSSSSRANPTSLALLLSFSCLASTPAAAQDMRPAVDVRRAPSEARDARVRREVDRILAQRAYRELGDENDAGLVTHLRELFERLFDQVDDDAASAPRGARGMSRVSSVPDWLLWGLGALVLLWLLVLFLPARPAADAAFSAPEPPVVAARKHLTDAESYEAVGDRRAALRALYLATLTTLARLRLLEIDRSATNWQYIQRMPEGEARTLFGGFTRLFDRIWYGRQAASEADYQAAKTFAERICGLDGSEPS